MHIITRRKFIYVGIVLISSSLVLGLVVFGPLIYQEGKYQIGQATKSTNDAVTFEVDPTDKGFTIIVPKIGAHAAIISEVNPYDKEEYLEALSNGVAHAKGTALPGEKGNIFLFAHSSDNFYNANRYNSVFYLLNKLEIGDIIYITYNNKLFSYNVTKKEVVDPSKVEYIENKAEENALTLMTCWPAGTTNKRLIVKATEVKN